jgi:hypothetical protein
MVFLLPGVAFLVLVLALAFDSGTGSRCRLLVAGDHQVQCHSGNGHPHPMSVQEFQAVTLNTIGEDDAAFSHFGVHD